MVWRAGSPCVQCEFTMPWQGGRKQSARLPTHPQPASHACRPLLLPPMLLLCLAARHSCECTGLPVLLQTGKLQGAALGPTLRSIYSSEGLPGLFRGNGASVLRIVPYAAVHFWCYEHYRRLLVAAEVLGAQVSSLRFSAGVYPHCLQGVDL